MATPSAFPGSRKPTDVGFGVIAPAGGPPDSGFGIDVGTVDLGKPAKPFAPPVAAPAPVAPPVQQAPAPALPSFATDMINKHTETLTKKLEKAMAPAAAEGGEAAVTPAAGVASVTPAPAPALGKVAANPFAGLTPNTADYSRVYQSEWARLQKENPTWTSAQIVAALKGIEAGTAGTQTTEVDTSVGATPAPAAAPTAEPPVVTPTPAPAAEVPVVAPVAEAVVTPPVTTEATPAPVADAVLVPAATDTPVVASAKTQVQTDLDTVADYYRNLATMKDDPAFRAKFNQTMMTLGLQNQAASDALKMRINQDPSLRGQPAGEAILSLWASKTGMAKDQLIAEMGVEELKRIADLNKYGIDGLYKLSRDKMSDNEKDLLDYGQVLDRMIASGATDEQLNAYFNKNIVPLLDGKDITLDQFRSPTERLTLITGARDASLTLMRDALSDNNLSGAIDAFEAAYTPAVQVERGKNLIANNDLSAVNAWLKDAGFSEVTDVSELIGREDDVFAAKTISDAKKKLDESPLQPQIDSLLDTLKGRGIDITDPDVLKAVNDYVYQATYGDPEQPNVLPWDSDVTSWQYKDWEIFNPSTGAVVSAGDEFYDPQDNPEPQPGSAAYTWRATLDSAWQKYLRENPDSKKRLSRTDWFNQLKADYIAAKDPNMTIGDFINGTEGSEQWKPDAKKTDLEDVTLTAADQKRALGASADPYKYFTDNLSALVDTGVVKRYTTAASLPTSSEQWQGILTDGNSQGFVEIGGKPYQIIQEGGKVVRDSKMGDIVVLQGPPPDNKQFIMKVNAAGGARTYGNQGSKKNLVIPVGTIVPMLPGENSETTFVRFYKENGNKFNAVGA